MLQESKYRKNPRHSGSSKILLAIEKKKERYLSNDSLRFNFWGLKSIDQPFTLLTTNSSNDYDRPQTSTGHSLEISEPGNSGTLTVPCPAVRPAT